MSFLPPGVQYTGPRLIAECSPEELHRRRQAKYDELWGENVGDQLAKGWADNKAHEVAKRHAAYALRYQAKVGAFLDAEQRRLLREYLAEEAAEEATLP